MKGCTFKRHLPSGKIVWGYSVDAGRDEKGNCKRVYKSGYEFKRDAEADLLRVLQEMESGVVARPDPRTLSEFFEQWFEEYAEHQCSNKTIERYHELARHVTKHLGGVQLSKVTTLQLQRVYNLLLKSGGKNGQPLGRKTVRNVHGVYMLRSERRLDGTFSGSIQPMLARFRHCRNERPTRLTRVKRSSISTFARSIGWET